MVAVDRTIAHGIVAASAGSWLSVVRCGADGPLLVMSESVYL